MATELQSLVLCDDMAIDGQRYVLNGPGTRFGMDSVSVFAELVNVKAGSTIWTSLIGPDGEELDLTAAELVPQNMSYVQYATVVGTDGLERFHDWFAVYPA